jgi:ubiquinone/menaquinone biosynthesis C-methylase UbiE
MNDDSEDIAARRAAALRANQRCYDGLVAAQAPLCRPASDSELADPLGTLDPIGWLGGSVKGKRLLCLAAGGGRQSVLYATAGAIVTVVDISPAMLELDRQMAHRRGLQVRLVQASMDRLEIFENETFDIIVHPVSTCYVPDVLPVFRGVGRILCQRGIYISQHKSPISLQASHQRDATSCYRIEHEYYRREPIPSPTAASPASGRLRERGAIEYLHRLEQLIGGICRSGMVVEDFVEPLHVVEEMPANTFADRARFIAPYLRIKARRADRPSGMAGSGGPSGMGGGSDGPFKSDAFKSDGPFKSGSIILPG